MFTPMKIPIDVYVCTLKNEHKRRTYIITLPHIIQ